MTAMTPRIIVTEPYAPDAVERLRRCGEVVELDRADPAALRTALRDADALLVRTYVEVTAELLAVAPRLKVIGRGGVGLDNIDVPTALRRGIAVVYTPAASTRSVAEHALGLLLALNHQLVGADRAVRGGSFHKFRGAARFRELPGANLGIIGMGRIGSLIGAMASRGLGMRVLYNDIAPVGPFDYPVQSCSKDELFRDADVITLHVPLTAATRQMIDTAVLARMKHGALLINTSRGAVIDLDSLAQALAAGQIGGAALDVFDPEPLPADHLLLAAPNTLLSPHIAGRSIPALDAMNGVVDDVVAVLEGRRPRYQASAADWPAEG